MKLAEIRIKRVMSREDAQSMNGTEVPEKEPNLTEACLARDADTDAPIFFYCPFPGDPAPLRQAVLNVKMGKTRRASGMENLSRTFGFSPKNVVMRRESCRPSSIALEQPREHAILTATSKVLADLIVSVLPDIYQHDHEVLSEVPDEWKMSDDALWTSGVINKASQLPYHQDQANFSTWSAMPTFRRQMLGGYLDIPEYGVTIGCRDAWVTAFNGFELVHGVTPMTELAKNSYRYSAVYYAMRRMKDCHTYAVEVGQARRRRTAREEAIMTATEAYW
jgi:hypothetical protein